MSKTLILIILFLFTLLFLIVARWKEILSLWKSTWGKIVFVTLLCLFVFFSVYDIASRGDSNDSSLKTIVDSLNVKEKRTIELIAQISKKVDSHNDSIIDNYNKFGPSQRLDTGKFNDFSEPLALSKVPQIFYLSDNDIALVMTLANVTNKPAYIGQFKSFQVGLFDSLIQDGATSLSATAIKHSEDKSVIRIGMLKELPSFLYEYQIIIFIHSAVKVHSPEKNTLVYITSLTGKDYCDGQSLTFNWTQNGMLEQPEFTELICTYLNEHLPPLNK